MHCRSNYTVSQACRVARAACPSAGSGVRLVLVIGRVGVDLSDSPQTGHRPAQSGRHRICAGIASASASWAQPVRSRLVALDVGAEQLLVARGGLLDLARVDLDRTCGGLEAAHAAPPSRPRSAAVARSRRRPRDVEPAGVVSALDAVRHASVSNSPGRPSARVACRRRARREAGEVDGVGAAVPPTSCLWDRPPSRLARPDDQRRSPRSSTGPGDLPRADPADVPRYDELQASGRRGDSVRARAGARARNRHRRDHPAPSRALPRGAQVTGLDSRLEMVFAARELGIEVRLARMEDPLPDGPWDPGDLGADRPPPRRGRQSATSSGASASSRGRSVLGDVVDGARAGGAARARARHAGPPRILRGGGGGEVALRGADGLREARPNRLRDDQPPRGPQRDQTPRCTGR